MTRLAPFLACSFLVLFGTSAGSRADIPFLWLDAPTGRNNPHDPRSPLYSPAAAATSVPTYFYDAKDPVDNAAGGATVLSAQTTASATALSAGQHYIGDPGDSQDWYLITVTANQSYDLSVVRAWGTGTIGLEIRDAANSVILASSAASSGNVVAPYSIPNGVSQILVLVSRSGGLVSYALEHQNVSVGGSSTPTFTATPTQTPVPVTSTNTATSVPTSVATATFTETFAALATSTSTPLATALDTATETKTATPTASSTPADSATASSSPTVTATFTDVPAGSTQTNTPQDSATATQTPPASPSFTATDSPTRTGTATVTITATVTSSVTATPSHTRSATQTSTSTPTRTATASPSTSPTASLTTILYDGDTAGAQLADGLVTSDESATAGTGVMSEAAGGNPSNMMRLTYANQTGYWQSHNWNKTVNVPLGANDYLEFEVRQEGATAVSQFKMVIDWGTGDAFVEPYLVAGGVIDTTWKTVRVPLGDIKGSGQTQFDFISFINNTQNTAYTVNVDNLRLVTSVPTATPTSTHTVNPAWSFTFSPTISPTPNGFSHPGAWSSAAELAFVKGRITAAAQPWTARLANVGNLARTPNYASLSVANVINACNGDANIGQDDSQAAYSQALAWAVTGNVTYANRSVAILNAWSNLNSIQSTACWVDQKTLDAGWFGANFANAAEIMRTYPSWTAPQIVAFQAMLQRAFVPLLTTASAGNGNVDLTQIDALMSIGVFRDDVTQFNAGITRLATRVPAYIHLSGGAGSIAPIAGDGGNPAGFYFNPTSWLPGVQQETCRDNGHHVQFALGSAIHAAEIAWHQGNDIYTTHQARFVAALELLALQITSGNMQGTCADNVTLSTTGGLADTYNTFEIGYNHYALRQGVAMPNTLALINNRFRPVNPTPGVRWEMLNLMDETLTHAGVN